MDTTTPRQITQDIAVETLLLAIGEIQKEIEMMQKSVEASTISQDMKLGVLSFINGMQYAKLRVDAVMDQIKKGN